MLKNQVKIKVLSSKIVNDTYGYRRRYYLQLLYKNNDYKFTYYDSVYNYCNNKKLDKMRVLYCVLMDCNAYDTNKNIECFADCFGFEKRKDLLKAYNGCEKTSDNLHRIFTDEEIEQLYTEFQDY